MDRTQRWYGRWGNFLTGVFIGLVIVTVVTPVLAMPPDLPVDIHGDLQFYLLLGSGLLLIAGLVLRTMRAAPVEPDVSARYGTRYFPDDRPIALE